MKWYVKWFEDFGISVYPVKRFKKGFDLVLFFVTISVDYGQQDKGEDQKT